MDRSVLKQFSFDFKTILIDEIALGGLEGIGLDFLWRRLEKRIESPVTGKMRSRFWVFLVNCDAVTFYQLPEPFPVIEIKDRYELIDEATGNLTEPEDYLDGPYEYCPIENEYGSSKYYNTRVLIPKETIQNKPYDMVFETFGDKLAMVASLEERFHALAPHLSTKHLKELSKVQYCILELIGRARENGQMCTGKTNVTKIIKDPKLVFYNRKFLQTADMVKIQGTNQVTGGRVIICLLLILKRFSKPFLQCMPKHGKRFGIIQHLLEKPDYKDDVKKMFTEKVFDLRTCKHLFKTQNVFKFENKGGVSEKKSREMAYKRIRLELSSDESSQSDNEGTKEPRKCQYKIKMNILRQAYEQIVNAGATGLSMVELAELLGLEFYTARTTCRILKARKVVKEYYVDIGKQKTSKLIALHAASKTVDVEFETEKKLYLAHMEQEKAPEPKKEESDDPEDVIPLKKLKMEEDITELMPDSKTIEKRICELKIVHDYGNKPDGYSHTLLRSNRPPTLRQLRYANGILDVIKEKLIVNGWQFLNTLVSRKIKEPLMDSKPLKILIQKLISDGQLKALKMTWPIHQKTSILFCSPSMPSNDPIIKAKYREINLVALRNKREEKKLFIPEIEPSHAPTRPITMSIYPRYLKLQKLHETIMKFVYFNDTEHKPSSAPGFCTLNDLVPEFTVDFVLGYMSHSTLMEMVGLKIPYNLAHVKIRDVPAELLKVFLTSYNLQNLWKINLKYLAMLGLIQMIKATHPHFNSYYFTYEFYVNTRVNILDTTGEWPRVNVHKDALERTYQFESFGDVQHFWTEVYNISTNTQITLERESRVRKQPVCAPVFTKDVNVDGFCERLGDGKGPCGFDSSFHMERPRGWVACHTKLKEQALLKISATKIPKNKKTKLAPKPKRIIKKRKPKKTVAILKKPPVQKPVKRRAKVKCFNPKWSKDDDKIIMLCKAAITIMSPSRTIGCLKIRNLAAKDILSICDPEKKAAQCHKRAMLLETNTTFNYELDCIINELKRYPHILKKYENVIKENLRIRYSGSLSKIYHASRLHLLELVWILWHLRSSESFKKKTRVALNIEDFHQNFILSPLVANINANAYRTPLEEGPVLAAIKEGIMIAIISSYKMNQSLETSQAIRAMFSSFTEDILRPAMNELRKSGAVSTRDKLFNASIDKFHAQDMLRTSFKLSSHYQRHLICRLNSEFVNNVIHDLNAKIPKVNVKGSSELNCILMELNTCGIIDLISVSSPSIACSASLMQEEQISVQDMMMKFKLKSGSVNWDSKKKFKTCAELLHVEYTKSKEELLRKSVLEEPDEDIVCDQLIENILENKGEKGATYHEIKNTTGYDTKTLVEKLQSLESAHILKRVGYYENVIVLTKYAKPWTLPLKRKHIIPTPWLNLDMDIRSDIFLRWSGVVMNKVFMNPGYSIATLSEELEMLTTRATQDVCTILQSCKCVSLKCARESEPDLFSDCDCVPELEDYNEYESVHNIFVFPEIDALIRYATFRRKMSVEDP